MMGELASLLPLITNSARTIAFTGGKGGVGTSVIALNTAICLAEQGKRVLLLDGNLGLGSLHILLGYSPRFDIRHVIAKEKELRDIIFTGPKGIHLIPAVSGSTELADGAADLDDFFTQLDELKASYDFILVDTGSGIGLGVERMISAADEAIIVTRPEPTALANAYALIKVIVTAEPAFPFHLLINMARDARQAEQVFHALEQILVRFLGYQPGNAGYVVTDAHVGHGVVLQVPFMLSASKSKAAVCLRDLAKKLIGAEPQERPRGLNFLERFLPKNW